ncbi:hypothetical protein C0J52_03511 [Blattella germanica]|nr:hypothetical protein C0J52_03511 [Blattella germanica]
MNIFGALWLTTIFLLWNFQFPLSEGAKILALLNVASPSHHIFNRVLTKELAARGHQDLQEFLDGAKDGFIFFSLGSNLHSDTLPKEKLRALLDAFAELPQRILWKFESDNLPGQPPNVKIGKWLPQSDIFAHPNIRLFISHCGKMSSTEATYRGVPMVGIPFFVDQIMNLELLKQRGVAVELNYHTLSKEKILTAVREVLNNKSYEQNMKRLSAIYRDHPQSALDRAIFWTEYVIRHGGAPHLRPASTDLYWYQYLLLDVMLVFISGAVIVLAIAFILIRKILNIIMGRSPQNKSKKTN